MGFGGGQQNQGQDQGYNNQIAAGDQTNKGYRQSLVQWSMQIDELSMLVERDLLNGQFNREIIYQYVTSSMGLWRVIRPQLQRVNNKDLLSEKEKKEFDYFEKYDNDIGAFLEPSEYKDENGKMQIDYKNIDDLNKLHRVILNALTRLDVLSSSVGY